MFGSFGRKRVGNSVGKKSTSKFKKGLIAGGLLLAGGLGAYAAASDSHHKEANHYDTVASDVSAPGVQGHSPAVVEKLESAGATIGATAAPAPAITLADAETAGVPGGKKGKIASGLHLAGDVLTGDVGKVAAVKQGYDIAKSNGGTKSIEEQIAAAEKAAKGGSMKQIGSMLGLTKGNKISKESVGVGASVGPALPPDFEAPKKQGKIKGLFKKKK